MRLTRRGGVLVAAMLATTPGVAHAVEGGAIDHATSHAVAIARGAPLATAVACSGTLVSPNVVLTVRHCLTPLTRGERSCDATLGDVGPGAAETTWVTATPWTGSGSSWKRAKSIVVPGPTRFCGDDVALLVLETPFGVGEATPARPIVEGAAFLRATSDHAIGLAAFGATSATAGDIGTRRSRFDIPIGCIPGQPGFRCGAELGYIDHDREFTTGRGPCAGDSGAGAMAPSDRSVIFGVLSRGDQGTEDASCAVGVFERTDRWAWLIARTVIDAATPEFSAPEWAARLFPPSPRSGDFCTATTSCGAGSECASLDGLRSWQCADVCESAASCGAGRTCQEGHCVPSSQPAPSESSCEAARPPAARWEAWALAGALVAMLALRRRGLAA